MTDTVEPVHKIGAFSEYSVEKIFWIDKKKKKKTTNSEAGSGKSLCCCTHSELCTILTKHVQKHTQKCIQKLHAGFAWKCVILGRLTMASLYQSSWKASLSENGYRWHHCSLEVQHILTVHIALHRLCWGNWPFTARLHSCILGLGSPGGTAQSCGAQEVTWSQFPTARCRACPRFWLHKALADSHGSLQSSLIPANAFSLGNL